MPRPLAPPLREPPLPLRRARVALTYLWQHRRAPNLSQPTRFTELVQLRKLHDRDPRLPRLADKLLAKPHVGAKLDSSWVTPTLWSGNLLPERPPVRPPFVLKSRHGCNQIAFVQSDDDWPPARARAAHWLAPYGKWLDEWLYAEIAPGYLIEPMLADSGRLPVDYKLFAFGGRVTHIQVHLGRPARHRWHVRDRHWHPLTSAAEPVPPPSQLPAMIAAAETLAAGFAFVRVDLYALPTGPRFGELTFYPGSGLLPIDPPWLDKAWGSLWLDALAMPASAPALVPAAA